MTIVSLVSESVLRAMLDIAKNTPTGCIVEVGVFQGGSAWFLNELCKWQNRELFLYDTFTGIPYKDDIDRHVVGDFSETDAATVRAKIPEAHVIEGVFPGSAVPMPPVAFAHIDCDQYKSVKESAQYLGPLMVPGGVMWFDDYRALNGATAAVVELFDGRVIDSVDGKGYVRF